MSNFRKNVLNTIKNIPRSLYNAVKEENTYFSKMYFIDKVLDAVVIIFVIWFLFPLVTALVGYGIIALVLKVLSVAVGLYLANVVNIATSK